MATDDDRYYVPFTETVAFTGWRAETHPARPGRPFGSKNRARARHHDVGKATKSAETLTEQRSRQG